MIKGLDNETQLLIGVHVVCEHFEPHCNTARGTFILR